MGRTLISERLRRRATVVAVAPAPVVDATVMASVVKQTGHTRSSFAFDVADVSNLSAPERTRE
jgi:hypothetical protein